MRKAHFYAEGLLLALEESRTEDHGLVLQNLFELLTSKGELDLLPEITVITENMLKERGQKVSDGEELSQFEENSGLIDSLNNNLQNIGLSAKLEDGSSLGVVVRAKDLGDESLSNI